jgi:hypothetical protein
MWPPPSLHRVSTLLRRQQWTNGLINLVSCAHTAIVGTVVNSEGGQDSFAFATVLPVKKIEVHIADATSKEHRVSQMLTIPFPSLRRN